MSFISVFDVIGPNMVGPSSSKMLGGTLREVEFILYGSFAKTYSGHGTDRALLGGIMGFDTDDVRIRDSFEIAGERGIAYSFLTDEKETDVHPNTVDIRMVNDAGTQMCVRGESLGGGKADQSGTGGVYGRVQCRDHYPEGQARCGGPYHEGAERPGRQYRLYAPVSGVQRGEGVYHCGVG